MEHVIYAGLRNPERDMAIVQALSDMDGDVKAVANHLSLSRSTVRAAQKRVEPLNEYDLHLSGGGGVSKSRSAKLQPKHSGAPPWLPTGTLVAPSATLSCRAGASPTARLRSAFCRYARLTKAMPRLRRMTEPLSQPFHATGED